MKSLTFTLFAALFLSACGELSYKRGANAADLEKAKQRCQSNSGDAVVEKCLESNGWTVQKLESFEVFSETTIQSETTIKNAHQSTKEDTTLTETSNSEKAANDKITRDKNSVEIDKNITANEPIQSTNKIMPQIQTNSKPSNPLDTFVVSSWWKTGVSADSFTKDLSACVAKLGEAHKPEGKTQTVTAGFIVCMRENGWKAIKKFK